MTRPQPPLHILIVEDEAILVMDLEAVIYDAGHEIAGDAASINELEHLSLHHEPDLALVDVNLLGGSSGLEAAEIIRQRWTKTKIVYVTANPAKVPPDHNGAFGVISKPFTERGLAAALRYICQGMCSPPPAEPKPSSFREFGSFSASW